MRAHVSPPRVRVVHLDWLLVYLGIGTAVFVAVTVATREHTAHTTQSVPANGAATHGVHAGENGIQRTPVQVPQPAAFWRFQVSDGWYRDRWYAHTHTEKKGREWIV